MCRASTAGGLVQWHRKVSYEKHPQPPRRAVTGSSVERQELEQWLASTAQGDEQAFVLFYQHTHRRVHGMVYSVLRDRHMSEDVTQEVFLTVWQRAETYRRDEGSPRTWLMTIAHRTAVDRVRSEETHIRRKARLAAIAHEVEYDDAFEAVLNRAEADMVTEHLSALSDLQRQAISMAFYDGMTYHQVAEELSAAPATVKSRIRDGLIKLRLALDADRTNRVDRPDHGAR